MAINYGIDWEQCFNDTLNDTSLDKETKHMLLNEFIDKVDSVKVLYAHEKCGCCGAKNTQTTRVKPNNILSGEVSSGLMIYRIDNATTHQDISDYIDHLTHSRLSTTDRHLSLNYMFDQIFRRMETSDGLILQKILVDTHRRLKCCDGLETVLTVKIDYIIDVKQLGVYEEYKKHRLLEYIEKLDCDNNDHKDLFINAHKKVGCCNDREQFVSNLVGHGPVLESIIRETFESFFGKKHKQKYIQVCDKEHE